MANLTDESMPDTIGSGPGPFTFDLPVDGGSKVFRGSLCTQLTATGAVVPYSTAAAGVCVGVALNSADNTNGNDGDLRVRIETMRAYAMTNGSAGDAFSEATLIGVPVYGTDDNTAAKTSNSAARKCVGFFMGMETDGKVRVFINPPLASVINALQTLTDTPASADALRDNIVASFG